MPSMSHLWVGTHFRRVSGDGSVRMSAASTESCMSTGSGRFPGVALRIPRQGGQGNHTGFSRTARLTPGSTASIRSSTAKKLLYWPIQHAVLAQTRWRSSSPARQSETWRRPASAPANWNGVVVPYGIVERWCARRAPLHRSRRSIASCRSFAAVTICFFWRASTRKRVVTCSFKRRLRSLRLRPRMWTW